MKVLNKIWNKNNWNKGSKEYNKWFHNISSDKQKSTTNRYSEPKTLSKIVDGIINDFSILINDKYFNDLVIENWLPLRINTNQFIEIIQQTEIIDNNKSNKLINHNLSFVLSINTNNKNYYINFDPIEYNLIEIDADGIQRCLNNINIIEATESNIENISEVSWGETEGLYPVLSSNEKYNLDKWIKKSTLNLLKARAAIDLIYNTRNSYCETKSPDLSNNLINKLAAYHLTDNFPTVDLEIMNNNNVSYFYMDSNPNHEHTAINQTQRIVKRYGPFYDITTRKKLYIIFYEATS